MDFIETPKFEVGDFVKHKEENLKMVVIGYHTILGKKTDRVICKWFDKSRAYTLLFQEASLEKIE